MPVPANFKKALLKIFGRPEVAEKCAQVIFDRGCSLGGWRWCRLPPKPRLLVELGPANDPGAERFLVDRNYLYQEENGDWVVRLKGMRVQNQPEALLRFNFPVS